MSNIFRIVRVAADFEVDEIQSPFWDSSDEVLVDKYWSGETAPVGRHFTVRALWSKSALYLRFTAAQTEPLVVSQKPDLSRKTKGLWDRDVCEIFIAPDPKNFRSYFEFEGAPTGEWIDLAVTQHPDRRETDFDYNSGMQTFGSVSVDSVTMAMRIGWQAFGKIPVAGERWKGNLLRCVGSGEERGYLAWQPTLTDVPNFHVPEKFGEFEFF